MTLVDNRADQARAVGMRSVDWARRVVREHRALFGVLLAAAVLRVAVAIAYAPALFFSDSWQYLNLAYSADPVGIAPSRPSGYPLILRVLSLAGSNLGLFTALQHLAGLLTGAVLYVVLIRFGIQRWLAAVTAGVVLLDLYAITLEQHILTEAFFTLTLVVALAVTVARPRDVRSVAIAGVLLAAAVTIKTVALFVAPVWLVYLLWVRCGLRPLLAGATALALPLLGYGTVHLWRTGSFGLQQAEGWFLYGRVTAIADCERIRVAAETRPLCVRSAAEREGRSTGYWIWDIRSPAERMFGGNPDAHVSDPDGAQLTARANDVLKDFSLAVIRARPLAYGQLVAADFGRFFTPGTGFDDPDIVTVTLPARPREDWVFEEARVKYAPSYVPHVRPPAGALRVLQPWLHAPRWLYGLLSLAALLALAIGLTRRGREHVPRRREILLLSGSGLVMLLASAASTAFVVRYLIPALPLLAAGGVLALSDLGHAIARRRGRATGSRPAPPGPSPA